MRRALATSVAVQQQ